MRTVTTAERRARLGRRHHLAAPVTSAVTAATDLFGLHSSDPATVFLSAWARVRGFAADRLGTSLYEDRSLVRMLGMRRTLFVVPPAHAAVMNAACTKALVAGERRRLVGMLEDHGHARDGAGWLRRVERATLVALRERGEASARELTADVPELGLKLAFGEGKTWGGQVGVSTRVLFLLATEARIVRVRPLGSWTSGQYRWAPLDAWLGGELPSLTRDEAAASLLTTWLRAFGPATMTDVRWWTGWTSKLAAATLASVGAVEVEIEDAGTGFLLPDDLARVRRPAPWVALLPGLDTTTMGWKERGWFLGPHGPALFDRNGNAGATVWADGSVVGGWRQLADGAIDVRLLEDVAEEARRLIDVEAERLATWLGDVRIKPRFPAPLDRERR